MDYLEEWYLNLRSKEKTSIAWQKTLTVTGECRRHTGPSIWFASVMLEFSPSLHFEVVDTLDSETRMLAQDRDWYKYVVFGVLDVMLTRSPSPVVNFKLCIMQLDFSETESNPTAFRLAARDAAARALLGFTETV